jgi:hypothetical protein
MMNEILELSRSVMRWQLYVLRTVNPLMFYLMSSMSYSPEDSDYLTREEHRRAKI